MTKPNERGVIFSAESVRAILGGRKTQTRRVVSRSNVILDGHRRPAADHWPHLDFTGAWVDPGPSPAGNRGPYLKAPCHDRNCVGDVHRLYPQWSVGQRIWVRETFCLVDDTEHGSAPWVDYRATPEYQADHPAGWHNAPDDPDALKWRSPIYMPRWASRIALEIADVRIERVRDISEEDAKAEGAQYRGPLSRPTGYRGGFADAWQAINARRGYSWDSNPWVVALTFRRTDADTD